MVYVISGFSCMIGYALLRTLPEGDKIIALVKPGEKIHDFVMKNENIKIRECDIRDYRYFSTNDKGDVFIHLAWLSTGGEERDNIRVQIDNIVYTVDAVELAAKMNCKVFIGAGSQAEYGLKNEKLSPDTPTEPMSAYGIAKYCAGKMSENLCDKYGMRINWVRFLSVYGEYDRERNFIPYLIKTFLSGGVPFVTDCTQIWDYIYCDDAARAVYCIARNGINKKSYPIGSGKSDTLKNYVLKIRELTGGKGIHFGARERKATEPFYLCADVDELRRDTGFHPTVDFDTGIKKCIGFIKENE
ncbi:MAG: NAD-dependent epimerase/dehydratase family protein [Eubacteriales bacterium]